MPNLHPAALWSTSEMITVEAPEDNNLIEVNISLMTKPDEALSETRCPDTTSKLLACDLQPASWYRTVAFQIQHDLAEQGHWKPTWPTRTDCRETMGSGNCLLKTMSLKEEKWMVSWGLLSCTFWNKTVSDVFKVAEAGVEFTQRTPACFRVTCTSLGLSQGHPSVWIHVEERMGHSSSWWTNTENKHSVKVFEIYYQMKSIKLSVLSNWKKVKWHWTLPLLYIKSEAGKI